MLTNQEEYRLAELKLELELKGITSKNITSFLTFAYANQFGAEVEEVLLPTPLLSKTEFEKMHQSLKSEIEEINMRILDCVKKIDNYKMQITSDSSTETIQEINKAIANNRNIISINLDKVSYYHAQLYALYQNEVVDHKEFYKKMGPIMIELMELLEKKALGECN